MQRNWLASVHVLLVEDYLDARDYITILLQQSGATVTAVSSVSEALVELSHVIPDVLVSDIGLPDESGYDLIRKIRTLAPDQGGQIPAIALTAHHQPEERQRSLEAGFQIHLAKPVDPDQLTGIILALVGR